MNSFSASYNQKGLWGIEKFHTAHSAYHTLFSTRIVSEYNIKHLENFFQFFIERQQITTATFHLKDGSLVQKWHQNQKVSFTIIDCAADSETALYQKTREVYTSPFDLEKGPLFRVFLFTKQKNDAVLLVMVHHILSDGWSLGTLIDEFNTVYPLLCENKPIKLEPLKKNYRDFVEWQENLVNSEEGLTQRSYWDQKLSSQLSILELPGYQRRSSQDIYKGDIHFFSLSPQVLTQIKECSKNLQISTFAFFMSVYQILFFRYTNEPDIIIGYPGAGRLRTTGGRKRTDFQKTCGNFVNPLLFRNNIVSTAKFAEIAQSSNEQIKNDSKYQDYPFNLIYKELNHRQPNLQIPQITLNFQKSRSDHRDLAAYKFAIQEKSEMQLGGLTIQPYYMHQQEGSSDLEWEILESRNQVFCNLKYRIDIFNKDDVIRIQKHLEHLISQFTKNPYKEVSKYQLITHEESKQIINKFNSSLNIDPATPCIHELFTKAAQLYPDKTALEFNQQSLSYKELDQKANQLAHFLLKQNVDSKSLFGLMIDRSFDMVITLLAILKSGAAFIPIDPLLPDERIQFMLKDSKASGLISQKALLKNRDLKFKTLLIDEMDFSGELKNEPGLKVSTHKLAYIIYTSGSTGKPKGVMLKHAGFVNMIIDHLSGYEMSTEDRFLQFASFSFDAALAEIFTTLCAGATLLLSADKRLKDPNYFPTLIKQLKPSIMLLPPAFLKQIDRSVLNSLRLLISAGEAANPDIVNELKDHQVQYINAYGPTEISVCASRYHVQPTDYFLDNVPIGKPISNIQMLILDHNLQLCPIGVKGELFLAGAGLAQGYINQPELTERQFINHPFQADQKIYKTGDIARWLSSGDIEFFGRIDNQIKLNGYRIELEEIESVIKKIKGVKNCLVIKQTGVTNHNFLTAFYTGTPQKDDLIKNTLKKILPFYMIPSEFQHLDVLPINNSGKIDRKKLNKLPQNTSNKKNTATLNSSIHSEIKSLWLEILEIKECNYNDNFFDLGGYSLKLIELQQRLKKDLEIDIDITTLFKTPTINSLTEHLLKNSNEEISKIIIKPKTVSEDIAIIGMAIRAPKSKNLTEFWENITSGKECISFFTEEELIENGVSESFAKDSRYIKAKGYLEDADKFDADFFQYSPQDAIEMDPQQRLFLECAYHGLEDANIKTDQNTIGVFASTSFSSYLANRIPIINPQNKNFHPLLMGNDKDFLATRIAYKLNLTGPAETIQSACSSSLTAFHTACQSLLNDDCNIAVVGGSSISAPLKSGYFYSPEGIGSPDGHCRTFDFKAKGTLPGNGVAVVILKKLTEALQDNDSIYAIIKGSAINNDGNNKVGFTAPSIEGQRKVIEKALKKTQINPETIGYIETHGTGTQLGDPIEIQALKEAFNKYTDKKHYCALGSVKPNFGHLDAAAGITGLIKAALCIYHKTLPAIVNFEAPNEKLQLQDSPFFIPDKSLKWHSDKPRRAAVSALGIGGTNVHILLEEAPASSNNKINDLNSETAKTVELLTLSARQQTALTEYQQEVDNFCKINSNIKELAYTLQTSRKEYELKSFRLSNQPIWHTVKKSATLPQLIFMFTGQGSQYLNMGKAFYKKEPVFRNTLDSCFNYLQKTAALDLKTILFSEKPDDIDLLNQTKYTQPAIFCIQYALLELWKNWGINPDMVIGHSIGEYAAAVAAGVLSWEDGLKIITSRGRIIQNLPSGSMLSVLEAPENIQEFLHENLWISAYNAPKQVVVSGSEKAITELFQKLQANSIKAVKLQISHAFHSPLLKGAVTEFTNILEEAAFSKPVIPFLSTVTGKFENASLQTTDYWLKQLLNPVCFQQACKELSKNDYISLEIGPGNTLCRLVQQQQNPYIKKNLNSLPDYQSIYSSLGTLWGLGFQIIWKNIHNKNLQKIHAPLYPFQKQKYWFNTQEQHPPLRKENIKEWLYGVSWKQTLIHEKNWEQTLQKQPQTWLIFHDHNGLGTAIAEELLQNKQNCIHIYFGDTYKSSQNNFVITAENEEHYHLLMAELKTKYQRLPAKIIHLGLFTPYLKDDLKISKKQGFYSLIYLTKALSKFSKEQTEITVITNQVYSVNYATNITPAKSLILGPIRVIPLEHPTISCQHLDLADNSQKITTIMEEITYFKARQTIAHYKNLRWLKTYANFETSQSETFLKRKGTYIITGGTGEIGLAIAELLLTIYKAKVILLSRKPLKEHSTEKINRINKLKLVGDLKTVIGDVSNSQSLDPIFNSFPNITGIFHCAGIPEHNLIINKTPNEIKSIFKPKVLGTKNIIQISKKHNIEFCFIFSSLSSITGAIEQVAYSSANAYIDAIAIKSFIKGKNIIAVNWPGWIDIGMTKKHRNYEKIKNLQTTEIANMITKEEGLKLINNLLPTGITPQVIISPNDLIKWQTKLLKHDPQAFYKHPENKGITYTRPNLDNHYEPPVSSEEQKMVLIWEELLNLKPIGITDNFFELGGHSLSGLEMLSRAEKLFSLKLQLQDLYKKPTIKDLCASCYKDTKAFTTIFSNELNNASELIELQKGDKAKLLFLFEPIGVNVHYYQHLIKYLNKSYSIFGIRTPRIKNNTDANRSLEEIARICRSTIMQLNTDKHINLAGASMGGVIAYEAARQLLNDNYQVDLVAMFDSPGPNHLPKYPAGDAEILHELIQEWIPVPLNKLQQLKTLKNQSKFIIDFSKSLNSEFSNIKEEQLEKMVLLAKSSINALYNFKPQPLNTNVLFLKATEPIGSYDLNADQAWCNLAEKFECYPVPGNHYTMNMEPNVSSIANYLNQKLEIIKTKV